MKSVFHSVNLSDIDIDPMLGKVGRQELNVTVVGIEVNLALHAVQVQVAGVRVDLALIEYPNYGMEALPGRASHDLRKQS
jgi:hypothetical protein